MFGTIERTILKFHRKYVKGQEISAFKFSALSSEKWLKNKTKFEFNLIYTNYGYLT